MKAFLKPNRDPSLPTVRPVDFRNGVELEAAGPYLTRRSIPVVAALGGKIGVEGTASIIEIAGQHFLVTVGHLLEGATDSKASILIPDQRGGFIEYDGPITYMAEDDDVDRVDVGVGQLTPALARRLTAIYQPLTLADVYTREEPIADVYAVVGFLASDPAARRPTPRVHVATIYEGEPPEQFRESIKKDVHFLLDLRNQVRDRSDRLVPTPSMKGMSGSPVWCMTAPTGAAWSPSCLRVLAIQTRVLIEPTETWIRCTGWGCVAGVLWDMFPATRSALEAAWGAPPK